MDNPDLWFKVAVIIGLVCVVLRVLFSSLPSDPNQKWMRRLDTRCEGVTKRDHKRCKRLGTVDVQGYWLCEVHAKSFRKEINVAV